MILFFDGSYLVWPLKVYQLILIALNMELNGTSDGILLGLAVSIGNATADELLNKAFPNLVQQLHCNAALLLKQGNPEFQELASAGLNGERMDELRKKLSALSASQNEPSIQLVSDPDNAAFQVFTLDGFGLLALGFSQVPDAGFISKLTPIITLFANALRNAEQIAKLSSECEAYGKERSMLHAIIQNIPDPVYVKDKDGRKIILNKAEAQLLGKSNVAEVLGKKDSDFYPEHIALKTEEEDQLIIKTGKTFIHRDGILTTHNGKEIWLKGTKIPHFNEKGEVCGIIGISHDISEHKRIENEVRIVAEKYQAIFNSFVDLYFRSDINGAILELSPSVAQLTGYQAEELSGRHCADICNGKERYQQMVTMLLEKGSVNDFENTLVRKDGIHIPVSITSRLIKNENGDPAFIEGTIRNISDRKEHEEKLNKLLALQNLLTHLATEFINIPVESSNNAITRLLEVIGEGIETDRVFVFEYDFGKNTLTNTHEWCAKDVSREITNLQQVPIRFLPTWLESHKKGEMHQVCDISKLQKNDPQYAILRLQGIKSVITLPLMANASCFGFVGFNSVREAREWTSEEIVFLQVLADLICNVTDRKNKEEALRSREASLKAIFNNVPFQMWLKDADSKYIAVNKPFMDYFSITSEDEIIGKDAMDIWHNDVGQHFMEQDRLVMQQREMNSVEELIDFKHKSVWFEIFRAPIIDQKGQILGTTGIARDITSRKITNKTLQQAVETAQAATEAKSKYLAIMSHEIRNPLNAVVGMVRMLYESGVDGPNRKLVENIKTSSDHLLMIVNDILDFSKIEAGDMCLEETSFDIHEVVKRVFGSHVYIAREKQVDLNYLIDEQIGSLHKGDPLRLQQVLSNLVSNAIKFTPRGRIEIRCKLQHHTGLADSIRFEVMDTGIGISAESQQKIFESFKQEDNSISRNYGGSGLGLAISKQIVEMMGGKLSVESAKNEGSLFYFTIELPVAEKGRNNLTLSGAKPGEVSLVDYSILLVEDNKLNQILATTILEKWGAKVSVAGNGQQAIDLVETGSFDIILMDIQMPVMDGMTASKLIREKLKIDTPILALSANVVKGIVEKCEEAGMQGYISKPFDSDDLYRKIIMHTSKTKFEPEPQEEVIEPDIVVADVSRLEKMIGSDPVQLKVMLNKFLVITPAYIAELNDAEAANDLQAIAAASHKIKASIDLVSAPVLRDLILNINQSSRQDGDMQAVKPMIRQFNAYYHLLEIQLRQEISADKVFNKVG